MRKLQLNINSFKLGAGPDTQPFGGNFGYTERAHKLVNFIPRNNNILSRRPGTSCIAATDIISVDPTHKLFTVELEGNTYVLIFSIKWLEIYSGKKLINVLSIPYQATSTLSIQTIISSLTYCRYRHNNSIIIFAEGYPPYILSKNPASNQFEYMVMEFIDGPYEELNQTDITLTVTDIQNGLATVVASSPIFIQGDKGLHLRIYDETNRNWGWGIIGSVYSECKISVIVKQLFSVKNSTVFWRKGAFNHAKGYPKLGLVFNSRLYLAHVVNNHARVWASCYNDYTRFSPTISCSEFDLMGLTNVTQHNSAITFVMDEVSELCWLHHTLQYVILGSNKGVFALMPLDFRKSLSPFNYGVKQLTHESTTTIMAGNGYYTFYIGRSNELSVIESSNNPDWLNIIHNILPTSVRGVKSITNIAFSSFPEKILTILFNTEEMAVITINNVDGVNTYAYSDIILGGDTPKVKAISSEGQYLHLLVERVISHQLRVTLEYIDWRILEGVVSEQMSLVDILQYLDCNIVLQNNVSPMINVNDDLRRAISKNEFSNVSVEECIPKTDIINSIIYVLSYNHRVILLNATGFIESEFTKNLAANVSSDDIYLHGYSYPSYYESQDLNTLLPNDSGLTYKKLCSVSLRIVNSLGGALKANTRLLYNDIACPQLSNMNNTLFTGDNILHTNFTFHNTPLRLVIEQNLSLPFNLTYIGLQIIFS